MTIKASNSIKRDGDTWWVDDPRAEQVTSQPAETVNASTNDTDTTNGKASTPDIPSAQYDADGYDADGYDAEGYDAEGYDRNDKDRNGCDKYPF